jgi:3-oxoacyl-[acyl-carrier protein] reductase
MSTSSAMVQMLIKTVALETAFHGVRINGVAAGVTRTTARCKGEDIGMGLTKAENSRYLLDAARDVPLVGQLNSPKDVANALLFLASPDASFTTGEIMVIDGGQSLTTDKYDDYIKLLKNDYENRLM